MKFFKFNSIVLAIVLVGLFLSTAYPRDSLTRSRELSICYNTGYSMGCDAGLTWRSEGLPFNQDRINFLKKILWRKVTLRNISEFASTAWGDGYDDGWKDGYYITTDNYDNIWKPLR